MMDANQYEVLAMFWYFVIEGSILAALLFVTALLYRDTTRRQ